MQLAPKPPKPPSSAPTSAKKGDGAFGGFASMKKPVGPKDRKRKSGKGRGRPKVSSRKLFGGKEDLQDHRGYDENGEFLDEDSGTDESEDLSDDDGYNDGKLALDEGPLAPVLTVDGGYYSHSNVEKRLLQGKEYVPMPHIPASQFHARKDEGKLDKAALAAYDEREKAHKKAMKNEKAAKAAAKAAAKKQKTKK
jgi:hypothetical protein